MIRHNPHYGYPRPGQGFYGHSHQAQVSDRPTAGGVAQKESPYRQQNTKTHFAMGLIAGAAAAYLLSNKKFREGVSATGGKAWSAVRGEVEELKERLEDTQAELEYYRL